MDDDTTLNYVKIFSDIVNGKAKIINLISNPVYVNDRNDPPDKENTGRISLDLRKNDNKNTKGNTKRNTERNMKSTKGNTLSGTGTQGNTVADSIFGSAWTSERPAETSEVISEIDIRTDGKEKRRRMMNEDTSEYRTINIKNSMSNTLKDKLSHEIWNLGIFTVDRTDPPDKVENSAAILELLRLDHLNEEERWNIETLVMKHLDRFQFPDERLEATNAV